MKKETTYKFCHCGREIPLRFNSTIRDKECPSCKRIKDNKKLLARSAQAGQNKQNKFKSGDNATFGKSASKGKKTASETFYGSTTWYYFSRYVLLFYSPDGVMVFCSTCGKPLLLKSKKSHCGHLIKVFDGTKTHYSVALDFINAAPQCSECNNYKGGCQDLMRVFLEKKHGKEQIDELYIRKNNICRADAIYFETYKEYWKNKFEGLLIERKWENPWK